MATKTQSIFQKAHVSFTAAQKELQKASKLAKTPELRDSLKKVQALLHDAQL